MILTKIHFLRDPINLWVEASRAFLLLGTQAERQPPPQSQPASKDVTSVVSSNHAFERRASSVSRNVPFLKKRLCEILHRHDDIRLLLASWKIGGGFPTIQAICAARRINADVGRPLSIPMRSMYKIHRLYASQSSCSSDRRKILLPLIITPCSHDPLGCRLHQQH